MKKTKHKTSTRPEVEKQLREYFSESPREREAEAASRLVEFVSYLLDHSPARQRFAVEIYRACAKAWDAARDEYGHANLADPRERQILHSYHDLLVALEDELVPLPVERRIRRALEIYRAGADLRTRAAIHAALESGNQRTIQNVWATVSVYGRIQPEKKRA